MKKIEVSIKSGSGTKVAFLDGELSIYTVRDVKDQLMGALNEDQDVNIDLSGIHRLDSAGFQILLSIKKEGLFRTKKIQLVNPGEEVKRIFGLYRENL